MASNKCIVSFASKGRENYPKAQLRLIKSCVTAGWDGDYLIRSLDGDCDEYAGVHIDVGSYPSTSVHNHAEIPYGFKPDIVVEAAAHKKYKQIIWCDSTIVMAKYPNETLAHASKFGVAAFHNLGHDLWNWVSDAALQAQGLTERQLKYIKQIMACVICFDLSNPVGYSIFNKWIAASRDGVSFQNYGSNREGFKAHRHDQAVLSMILYKEGIPLLPYGKLVYEPHDTDHSFGDDFEFINKGIK